MKAIDVYCELRTRRMKVGQLIRDDEGYSYQYSENWLNFEGSFDLGPDLPLSNKVFRSKKLPESFASRIPSRDSANYARYCEERGISVEERDEMVLLKTIGHKGPSSFVFEENFEIEDMKIVTNRLDSMKENFSLRTLKILFNISMGSLQKILAKEYGGPSFQLIEVCLIEKSAFDFKLSRAHELGDETRLQLRQWAEQNIKMEIPSNVHAVKYSYKSLI
jgi:HipA-like protein